MDSQQGFSLLEVLVTMVVLSLGILGLAGLQSVALKNSHSALLRAQAAQYGYDMIDRLRANPGQAKSGLYDLNLGDTSSASSGLAKADVEEWLDQLRVLPLGTAKIKVTAAGQATILIRWSEAAMGNTAIHDECPEPRSAGEVCLQLVTEL